MTTYNCGYCGKPFQRYASDLASADREAIRRGRKPASTRFCSRACANLGQPRSGRPVGYRDPRIEATLVPTPLDIAWAAGIFEGEGNVSDRVLQVTQKDTWILDRLRDLFGGSVWPRHSKSRVCYLWSLSGSRKREFSDLIYDYLSPRRRAQIDAARRGPRWIGTRASRVVSTDSLLA